MKHPLAEQKHIGLAYLATVYSKWRGGDPGPVCSIADRLALCLEDAWIEASKLAARLICAGFKVYSPIVYTHSLAIHGGLDSLDHAVWLPFDEAMLTAADCLIVAHMEGWEESKGVAHEVAFFERAGKPIFDLDPATMQIVRRQPERPPHERYHDLTDEQLRAQTESYLS